jgi:endonuclease/exonuclease/phosphatase family metal-dependent hydrolase
MSWNLRTYGSVEKTADELRVIAETILNSRADIVCIQELMHGTGIGTNIGTAISPVSVQRFDHLFQELVILDAPSNWAGACTGRNAGRSQTHSADAYGFLWKRNPGAALSNFRHALPAMTIGLLPALPNNARILILAGFPNRRPGQLVLTIQGGAAAGVVPPPLSLSLISFHATTPTNLYVGAERVNAPGMRANFRIFPAAGTAIRRLNEFPAVVPAAPPVVNTIVLGDFNFDLSSTRNPPNPYDSLTGIGYNMRINNHAVKTTYRPDGAAADRFVSSYDNIFDIGPNLQFVAGSGNPIDFILQNQDPADMDQLLQAHGRWYGIQHGGGVSDHLPVVAEYDVA